MIRSLRVYHAYDTDPYQNLAIERYLTHHTPEGECRLFLWQNRHTIVIGRNQNAWAECETEAMEQDGIFLVRRLSGGGAVFHDLGNLNYTFCVRRQDYDLTQQLQVILEAVRSLGIPAEISGRNDLTVDGRKFSGNAFYESGEFRYHHGTLMVDVDLSRLGRYLRPSPLKLQAKGIPSVRSRVVNLRAFCPELTTKLLGRKLVEACEEVYGKAAILSDIDPGQEEIRSWAERFASWDWNYGRRLPFTHQLEHRFTWGILQLTFSVNEGRILSCSCHSDAMKTRLIQAIPDLLKGCRYDRHEIADALSEYADRVSDAAEENMLEEITQWLLRAEAF